MTIQYRITPSDPQAHLFSVEILIAKVASKKLILTLPAWIPGSYMIRDFARHIVSFKAFTGQSQLVTDKLDKQTWRITGVGDPVIVQYEVYAWDLSVRAAHLDTTHGFFNGTSVFLAVQGYEQCECVVEINRPVGMDASQWGVATALTPSLHPPAGVVDSSAAGSAVSSVDADGFGWYRAADYDELIDHPVEMGTFESATFDACGVEHQLVLTGRYTTDIQRICVDLKRICEYQIRFFGEPAPVKKYVFMVMVTGDGYGGLEHRASTALMARREHLPIPGDEAISDDYLEFLGLCSHEYFHTWNVKRIKPATFVPYKLAEESYTTLLWAFEGITSYYDDLVLVKCGLIDQTRYLTLLGKTITRVYRGVGRHKQSVAASSFDAWTRFYKQDENAPNAIVSYYTKGSLVALSLDQLLTACSSGNADLQMLLCELWKRYRHGVENSVQYGVGENEFEAAAVELCDDNHAPKIRAFFKEAVFGTDDLALSETLKSRGIVLHWRAATSQSDAGGTPGTAEADADSLANAQGLSLGARLSGGPTGLTVTHVFEGQSAHLAGIAAGDRLIALQGLAMTSIDDVNRLLRRQAVGDVIPAHLFRRDELQTPDITLQAAPLDTCYLTIEDEATAGRWLGEGG